VPEHISCDDPISAHVERCVGHFSQNEIFCVDSVAADAEKEELQQNGA
jgi:hypothetical protein